MTLCLGGGMFVAMPALAQDVKAKGDQQAPSASTQQGWAVNCVTHNSVMRCTAAQTIVVGASRQLLLRVTVSKAPMDTKTQTDAKAPNDAKAPADGSAGMMIQLPHGLFNPAGISVRVDEHKAEVHPIQTCDPHGCYVGLPVTPDRLKALRAAGRLNVQFQDLSKNNVTVPVPLAGFGDAYGKL